MSVDQQDRDQNAAESGWQPQPQPETPPKKRHRVRNITLSVAGGLIGLTAILGGIGAVVSPDSTTTASHSAPAPVAPAPVQPAPAPAPAPTNDPGDITFDDPAPVEAPAEEPAEEPAAPTMTTSQEQAVGKANDYLDSMAFSRSGLIEQLEYEGFSTKDAKFAVSHVSVNWNTQAAGSAEDYLDSSHFSRSGLIEQLEYEGFTHSQAVYGVDKAGL
jgi:Host cell surface-exposed lipoprotein